MTVRIVSLISPGMLRAVQIFLEITDILLEFENFILKHLNEVMTILDLSLLGYQQRVIRGVAATYHRTVGWSEVDDAAGGSGLVVLLHYRTEQLPLPEAAGGRVVVVELLGILLGIVILSRPDTAALVLLELR